MFVSEGEEVDWVEVVGVVQLRGEGVAVQQEAGHWWEGVESWVPGSSFPQAFAQLMLVFGSSFSPAKERAIIHPIISDMIISELNRL